VKQDVERKKLLASTSISINQDADDIDLCDHFLLIEKHEAERFWDHVYKSFLYEDIESWTQKTSDTTTIDLTPKASA